MLPKKITFDAAPAPPYLVGMIVAGRTLALFLALAGTPALAQSSPVPPQSGERSLRIPGFPPIPLPPGARAFPDPGGPAGSPQQGQPRSEAAKPDGEKSAKREPFNPQKALADLFERLAKSKDADESRGLASSIERIWIRTTSDTAEVLMGRALTALQSRDFDVSLQVLDKVVALEPGWAEAWNKRATVRFLAEDFNGSMADIAHVLALEPRHFGALVGLANILQRSGFDKRALQVYRQVHALYPQMPSIDKFIEKLTLDVEGREI